MVPVYAIGSFCSLQWRHGAIYFDTLRDWCVRACVRACVCAVLHTM
jgi:hypothetical protein